MKGLTNYFAGRLADERGRKPILVTGWLIAAPVPFLLMWAPSWNWILFANVLLGASQGLTWSTTVIMKIDLAGPERRGLAMGLNEFAGYLAVSLAALATGYVAAAHGLRPWPFALGIGFVVAGLLLSVFVVRETQAHARHEARAHPREAGGLSPGQVFARTSLLDRDLSAISQAGLVNNLNDGVAWGLFPLVFAATGLSLREIGVLAAIYPAVWAWDSSARAPLRPHRAQVAHPSWRASATGVYRLWRDLGYAVGALVSGVTADMLGARSAVSLVAALTFVSGTLVALRLRETRRPRPDPGLRAAGDPQPEVPTPSTSGRP